MDQKIRLVASYLPQFFPTKENDEWWGKGFTEWTNVGKAQSLFKGHYQPRVPADLGYYDLRLPEVREMQADLARSAGIEGFCYWHYWFGNGKRVLDRVFKEVVETGAPDFPFCLAWANETWSGIWHGAKNKVLLEQTYPGLEDIKAHFYELLPAFQDPRYIRVDNKPFFMVYKPDKLWNTSLFLETWQTLAQENGIPGIYFIAQCTEVEDVLKYRSMGYDSVNLLRLYHYERLHTNKVSRAISRIINKGRVYDYRSASKYFVGEEEKLPYCLPSIIPNWDHSPRSGGRAYILHNSQPEYFREHVRDVFDILRKKSQDAPKLAIVKSWNEWGEGNYLEPDLKYGKQYLKVLQDELNSYK